MSILLTLIYCISPVHLCYTDQAPAIIQGERIGDVMCQDPRPCNPLTSCVFLHRTEFSPAFSLQAPTKDLREIRLRGSMSTSCLTVSTSKGTPSLCQTGSVCVFMSTISYLHTAPVI